MGDHPHGREGLMGKWAHMAKMNPYGKKRTEFEKMTPDGKKSVGSPDLKLSEMRICPLPRAKREPKKMRLVHQLRRAKREAENEKFVHELQRKKTRLSYYQELNKKLTTGDLFTERT